MDKRDMRILFEILAMDIEQLSYTELLEVLMSFFANLGDDIDSKKTHQESYSPRMRYT